MPDHGADVIASAPCVSAPGQHSQWVGEHRADVAQHGRAELPVHDAVVEGQRQGARPCAPRAAPSTTHGVSLTWPNARIAVSPGVRIGVPASTPNTPTLVIVIVPPARSAGVALPARAVSVSACRARASSGSVSASRVLDVRHDEAALGGRGDAEVHVVLDHDLLGGGVPGRVDQRVPGHRDEQRPGHEQQRRDPQLGELGQLPEPAHRRHRLGHVDLKELGDVRRGERARHHGRGHVLAHAPDRDALLTAGAVAAVAVRDPFPDSAERAGVPASAAAARRPG